jgi:3-phenylpropionate/trans-cinnamate dioxygenase ferredoxin subunit
MSESLATFPLNDLPPGTVERIDLGNDEAICLANVAGEIYAVDDRCTHAAVPLSGGPLEGRQIVCPWHGAMFDMKTGRATCGPAVDPVRCYTVHVEDDTIHIDA